MEKTNRIDVFDGLRVIAIFLVMIFHFFSFFEEEFYTYSFKVPKVFSYGYLGVELFFIISGFVITLTLYKCNSFIEFIKKRFIRLIPGMLICSTITMLFVIFFDNQNIFQNSKYFSNFLISNTFISPILINSLIGTNFNYIDGTYWSLWVEMQFYIFAGLIYFLSPLKFLKNFLVFAFFGSCLFYIFISSFGLRLIGNIIGENVFLILREIFKTFSYFEYSLWFLIGVIINKMNFGVKDKNKLYLLILTFIFQMVLLNDVYAISFTILIMIIFLLFLYKPTYIKFFANRVLAKVGVASYSIYLLHDRVGVLIINKCSNYFGNFNWILPIILIFVFSFFGFYTYKMFEVPFGKKLKNIILK